MIDVSLPYLPTPELIVFQILQVIIGVVIVGLGIGFYLIANLGPGPRDGLMTGLQKMTNLPIALIRAIIEIIAVVCGWYLGGNSWNRHYSICTRYRPYCVSWFVFC